MEQNIPARTLRDSLMSATECRPRQHLAVAAKLYPNIWRQVDEFRAMRGREGLGNWPDWCFLPIAGYHAIVSGGGNNRVPFDRISDVARLAALGAWRVTQGIYRFDEDLYEAIVSTELKGDIPADLLTRLPAWCVYIELQAAAGVHGFFAHLESDMNSGEMELRLLIDADNALLPVPLHLGQWDLVTALEKTASESSKQALRHGLPTLGSLADLASNIAPMVSLLLYLCSEHADYIRPEPPRPKRTKRGERLFPPDSPTTWDVGLRIGAALRRAHDAAPEESAGSGAHARPRAHIRRAHWHTFWTGPRDGNRIARVKWLPPIPVNVDDQGELPATVVPVKR